MKPGRPHARVTQPPPLPRVPPCSPRARSVRCVVSISSACSISATSRRGSLGEELDILLLPRDPDLLALAAAKRWIALAGHLHEQALAAGDEVELDEVAEELDEDDLAVRRVERRRSVGVVELDGRGPNGNQRRLARSPLVVGGLHARPNAAVVLDHQTIAVALRDV